MAHRWSIRGLVAVVLVLGAFVLFLAQDGVDGTTPYGSTWPCLAFPMVLVGLTAYGLRQRRVAAPADAVEIPG